MVLEPSREAPSGDAIEMVARNGGVVREHAPQGPTADRAMDRSPGSPLFAQGDCVTRASRLTNDDLHLYNEGTHYRLYDKLGAHLQVSRW